ncbi:branched-chain amino acid ABC transporter substrate-binding protein [Micromonospora radicis]|uniref:Branched-chain amino acid ABC transporter substrate-binding protein n=1 Tax=Micromonospora radicis TaxID=1894971 RepID=A0A418MSD0_9ACTN|nr:branched-chain amino acid ABC transporter substrate-binding protein [Micromonospora radicis]RIV36934.1 branched-chain amino acid ABC transporter substrate-binding protein [Micromonospora radicis]
MRRSYSRALGTAALAAVLVAAAGCQDAGGSGDNTASGDCGGKIAIFGAFTGDNAGLVLPSLNGAKLAIKQHNDANADCQIEMVEFDTQGDPAQATPVANQVAGDTSFLGVIGGHFSGESDATMPVYEAAGLVMVAPSATRTDLTAKGNKSFFRVVGNDGTQAGAVATYLKSQNAQRVFLIDDASAYGAGITAELTKNLGATVAASDKIQERQSQFEATISKIKAANADFVFYGGYTREAAPLVRQMRGAGVTAKFIGPDGLYDPAFPAGASGGAEGSIITCPCLPADKAGGTFTADYQAAYGQAPGSYGAEGFDAAQIFVDAFKDGKKTRAEILEYVKNYDKQGVSKYIKFAENGDVDPSRVVIWSYEIKGTAFEPLQELKLS